MPREQHRRNREPAKLRGARVLREVQQPVTRKRITADRRLVSHDPGDQPRDRVDDHQRRQLAARHDVIADRDRLGRQMLADPFVDPFVPAAQDHQVIQRAQPLRDVVRQSLAVGRGQDHRRWRAPLLANPVDRRKQRFGLQHHPRPAAKRHVVDDPVPIGREIPQVVHAQIDQPSRDRPSDDALGQRRLHHLRKDGDDVDLHSLSLARAVRFTSIKPAGGSTTIRRSRKSTLTMIPSIIGIITSPRGLATTSRLRSSVPSTSATGPTIWPAVVLTSPPTRAWREYVCAGSGPRSAPGTFNSAPASASASFIVSIPSSAMIGRPCWNRTDAIRRSVCCSPCWTTSTLPAANRSPGKSVSGFTMTWPLFPWALATRPTNSNSLIQDARRRGRAN